MEHELLERLIDFIENASPVIWEAATKQVAVQAASHLMWATLLFVATLALLYVAKKSWKEREYNSNEELFVVFSILAAATGILGLVLCTHGVSLLMNPEYYAIDNLLDLLQ